MTYQTCGTCGTLYISPRPSLEVLEWFYSGSTNYAFYNAHIFPASEQARRSKIFRPRARRLRDICSNWQVQGGTLIEVGAGFGTFCQEVRELGPFDRLVAVEPTPDLAASCRARGLEVVERPVEQIDFGAQAVDVIASFEVIEHLFSPRVFLDHCMKLLRPGGLVVLTCPNGQGFEVSTLGVLSDTVDHEHLNYFHPDSLALLARRCGLEVMEITTPGELDTEIVRNKVLEGAFDLNGQAFLQCVLIDDWERLGGPFQAFLAENGLSSHMWLVARKPV